jgi:hypothetical protein
MNEKMQAGFTYTIETVRDGIVIDTEVAHNLMPTEGVNHLLGVLLKAGTQNTTWYAGVFEGNYTPTIADTAAAFPADATESTAYSETNRVALILSTPSSGSIDNIASKAEFTFTATKTIYGGFISSALAKGATSGVLLSVVRFPSPKTVDAATILRATAGFTLISV